MESEIYSRKDGRCWPGFHESIITPLTPSASSKIYKVSRENLRFLQQDQTLGWPSKVQVAFMIRKISFLSGLLMVFICWGNSERCKQSDEFSSEETVKSRVKWECAISKRIYRCYISEHLLFYNLSEWCSRRKSLVRPLIFARDSVICLLLPFQM